MSPVEIRRRAAGPPLELQSLHPVLCRIYAARGISLGEELDLSLERLLPVSSLEGVETAVRLLAQHREKGRVLVVGDFDADGATSSALVVRALRAMGFAEVNFLVPDRFRLGYGLTPEIVTLAAKARPSLIVTVDNGISSIEGVHAARSLGIAVLITDHHLPGTVLPQADAMVNPNLRGATFGSRALAGVGVAFYLMAALARHLRSVQFRPADLLDLVALGTVADVVPLDRNNRILVAQGLRRIRAGRCVPGIRALLEAAGRRLDGITESDLGFAAAPRLNAAGRLTDMSIGIHCLLTDDPSAAASLAGELSRLNDERRDIEQRMQQEAVKLADAMRIDTAEGTPVALCLFDATWHQGVVGLVAGRIKDRWHRPVVAFAGAEGGLLRGSARSISGVHIRDALDNIATCHPGLLVKFGGHAMAAGLTLRESDLDTFRAEFAAEVARRVDAETLTGVLHTDGLLPDAHLNVDTARALRSGGPWGQGFPEPIFDGIFSVVDARIVGGKHLKMLLRPLEDRNSSPEAALRSIDAIAFGHLSEATQDFAIRSGMHVSVAYRLEVNEFRGLESLQLNCQHLVAHGRGACANAADGLP